MLRPVGSCKPTCSRCAPGATPRPKIPARSPCRASLRSAGQCSPGAFVLADVTIVTVARLSRLGVSCCARAARPSLLKILQAVVARAGLVDENQLCRIKLRLEGFPRLPRRHVGALLLRRVHGFLKLMPCRSKNRQIELTPTRKPRSPSNPRISSKVRSARSPISANHRRCAASAGSELRPFCDLASTLPLCRQRQTQLADTQSAPCRARRKPVLNRADEAEAQIARICPRHAAPHNSIYGPILTQSTTLGILESQKFRSYPTGNRSGSPFLS